MKGNSGFTLIELIVTVAILSIVLLLVAPGSVTQVERQQVLAEFQEIKKLLSLVRKKAFLQARTLEVEFSEHQVFEISNEQKTVIFDTDFYHFPRQLIVFSRNGTTTTTELKVVRSDTANETTIEVQAL